MPDGPNKSSVLAAKGGWAAAVLALATAATAFLDYRAQQFQASSEAKSAAAATGASTAREEIRQLVGPLNTLYSVKAAYQQRLERQTRKLRQVEVRLERLDGMAGITRTERPIPTWLHPVREAAAPARGIMDDPDVMVDPATQHIILPPLEAVK